MNINEIATIAARLKGRPRKAELFCQLTSWIESGAIDDGLTYEVAKFYAYFLPTVPAKKRTATDWIAQALGVKDIREYLRYMYSDGEWLYSSDGHRAHRVPTDLEPGFYDSASNRIELTETYPPISEIFGRVLADTPGEWYDTKPTDLEVIALSTGDTYVTECGKYFNVVYVKQAVNWQAVKRWTITGCSGMAIELEGGGQALIMPTLG